MSFVSASHITFPEDSMTGCSEPQSLSLQLALTTTQKRLAYQIRHDGYISYNYITHREDNLFVDGYDGRENVKTVLVFKDGVPAATVRLCLFDTTGVFPDASKIPAMEIFNDEIHGLMAQMAQSGPATRAVEVSRMARAPAFARDVDLIHAMFRAVGYLILHFDADVVLNACRPHHMPMYRRLGFQKLHEPRPYPNLTYEAGLMAYFRSDFGKATSRLSFLNGISAGDPVYRALFAGKEAAISTTSSDRSI
jgi:hypothetical protein